MKNLEFTSTLISWFYIIKKIQQSTFISLISSKMTHSK